MPSPGDAIDDNGTVEDFAITLNVTGTLMHESSGGHYHFGSSTATYERQPISRPDIELD